MADIIHVTIAVTAFIAEAICLKKGRALWMTGASGLTINTIVLTAGTIHVTVVATGFITETTGLKKVPAL